jgi:hypothetical protein
LNVKYNAPRKTTSEHPLVAFKKKAVVETPVEEKVEADGATKPSGKKMVVGLGALDPLSMMMANVSVQETAVDDPLNRLSCARTACVCCVLCRGVVFCMLCVYVCMRVFSPPRCFYVAAIQVDFVLSLLLLILVCLLFASNSGDGETSPDVEESVEVDVPWSVRKQAILKEYNVSGKIKVSATFMGDANDMDDGSGMQHLDVTRQRLAMLETSHGGENTGEVTQAEYVERIEKLHSDLQKAWKGEQRVLSLKLAIQCAKLLGEIEVPTFYPSMFVLVTEILDTFGDLVFERIMQRHAEGGKRLPYNFTQKDVSTDAKETCRNWFYKTACIRELLPRLYLEMGLIKCYRFLSDDEYPAILSRLGKIIRGIGDPMVAIYARTYLARAGAKVLPEKKDYATDMFYDYLYTFRELKDNTTHLAFLDKVPFLLIFPSTLLLHPCFFRPPLSLTPC